MTGFIIGMTVGAFIGVVVMCLCRVSAEADRTSDSNNDNLPNG